MSDDELRSLIRGPQGIDEDSVAETPDMPEPAEPAMNYAAPVE
jgi:hypothetical protein